MTCKSCQDALIALVAGGAEPNTDLLAHLQLCADCKTFFERERSLFAAIDSALHASANSPLPPSFFPHLRVKLNASVAPVDRPASVRRAILVAAVAAVMVLSIIRLHHGTPSQPAEMSPDDRQPAVEGSSLLAKPEAPKLGPPSQPALGVAPFERAVRAENRRQPTPTKDPAAEIIVPADQEVRLAQYAEQLSRRRRRNPSRMSDDALSADTKPLEVDLIQIAQLDVKPLADRPE